MEFYQNIHIIINNNKHHITKKDYKTFNNIIRKYSHLTNNKKHIKIPQQVLCNFYMILIDIIENIKDFLRDIDYLSFMNSLYKLNIYVKDSEYTIISNEIDDNIIDIDLLMEYINYNNSVLEKFIKENHLPNDFLQCSLNIANMAALSCITNNSCKCYDYRCCGFYHCKNIQNFILNNPLVLLLLNLIDKKEDENRIIEDIHKYNLFSFDGKINNLLDLSVYIDIKDLFSFDLLFILKLYNSSLYLKLQILFFIIIFEKIYVKEYILLHYPKFKEILSVRLTELNNKENLMCQYYIKYWIDKLNLDSNIINIMIESFHLYFPE